MFIDVLIILDEEEIFPSFIPDRLRKKSYPYSRTGEITELFREKIEKIRTQDYKETENHKYEDRLIQFYGTDYSCFTYSSLYKRNITYAIEKVDTGKPWTIVKSGTGERIKYFGKDEKFRSIDPFINFCEAL